MVLPDGTHTARERYGCTSPFSSRVFQNISYSYAITNIENTDFVFVRPNFLKNASERIKDVDDTGWNIEDHHVISFTSPNSNNNQCANRANSGWWFPLQVERAIYLERDTDRNTLLTLCAYAKNHNILETNLNGVYHQNETLNERTIAYCGQTKNCYPNTRAWRGNGDVINKPFNGQVIKLKKTKLFLSYDIQK